MKIAYLASPYSHCLPEVRDRRFREVTMAAAWLFKNGWMCYSPIAHSVAMGGSFGIEMHYWRLFDFRFLDACDYLVVLCIDGWRTSKGIKEEMDYATSQHKPIMYLLKEQGGRYRLGSMPY